MIRTQVESRAAVKSDVLAPLGSRNKNDRTMSRVAKTLHVGDCFSRFDVDDHKPSCDQGTSLTGKTGGRADTAIIRFPESHLCADLHPSQPLAVPAGIITRRASSNFGLSVSDIPNRDADVICLKILRVERLVKV